MAAASTSKSMPTRPLSPHLGVYKFTYTMLTSILNRITGLGLSLGLLLLVYWLMAVASGARSYARALGVLSSPVAKLVYAAIVIAFCYHLTAGIRHLVWDTGRGLERAQARASARVVIAVSIVLMLLIGYWLWVGGGRAP
jgi:succinate dehydrogenase / fumarate reductase, cytochrome b subunit